MKGHSGHRRDRQDRTDGLLAETGLSYRDVLDTTSDALFVHDESGRIVYVNQRTCSLFGYSEDELHGLSMEELSLGQPPYSQAEANANLQRALVDGHWVSPWRSKRKNGELFWSEVALRPCAVSGRRFVIASLRDVTERRKAEQEQEKLEAKLTDVIESMGDAFIAMNHDLQVTYFNTAAERMLGRGRAEVVGRYLFDAFPEARGSIFDQKYHQAAQRQEALSFEVCFEVPPYQNWFDVRVFPHTDGISVFFQITTERKRIEEALRQSERRNSALVDAIPDLMFRVHGDGTIWDYKAEKESSLYLPPAAFLGKKVSESLPPEVAEACQAAMRRAAASHALQTFEFQLRMRDAEMEFEARVVVDDQGDAVFIVRDITDRKRAERALVETERQLHHAQRLESLGVLAGGIAHDFNNLLQMILANASLLREETQRNRAGLAFVEGIDQAVRRASALTRQMLAYAGKGKFVVEPLDLSKLCAEIGELMKASVAKKAKLRFELLPEPPLIRADASQLSQVLMNLITNASEALGDAPGEIRVRTDVTVLDEPRARALSPSGPVSAGRYVRLEVSDTGCGMDEQTRAKIFEPFFSTKFIGRGLGLAAVQGIVLSHKGAIRVESQPGEGATFAIFFPVSEEPAGSQRQAPAPAPGVLPRPG